MNGTVRTTFMNEALEQTDVQFAFLGYITDNYGWELFMIADESQMFALHPDQQCQLL